MTIEAKDLIFDKTLYTKIDQVSTSLIYLGQSKEQSPADSEAVFSIHRLTILGDVSTVEAADFGNFSQVWQDRNDGIMFPPPNLENNFSTLFDGNNDHMDFGDAHNFDNAKAFTLSMWIRPDNTTQQRCLWSKAEIGGNTSGWGLYVNASAKIFLQVRATSQNRAHTFGITIQDNVWQHIVMTYSGNQNINGITLTVDNVLDTTPASGTLTNTLIVSEASKIGRRGTGFHFSGHIDRTTFWNKSLSTGEINSIYNARVFKSPLIQSFESDLLHYYRMGDDDTVTTLIDNKGAINGSLKNFPSVFEDIYKAEVV